MEVLAIQHPAEELKWFRYAFWLAIITIVYNLIEGLVSVYFGAEDEALTLFGFGVDSFIETVSALGIFTMVSRLNKYGNSNRNQFEQSALKITGWGFYLLSLGLVVGIILSVFEQHKPQTTFPGIIISVLSIAGMWLLIHFKRKTGRAINSAAILADANCNLVCMYMSAVLLLSSLLFELTGFGWFDTMGAAGIIWFSVKEGREAFEKARGKECGCHAC